MGAGVAYYNRLHKVAGAEWPDSGIRTDGTAITVFGLTCGTDYEFRIGSHGNGTEYKPITRYATLVRASTDDCQLSSLSIGTPSLWVDTHSSITIWSVWSGSVPPNVSYEWQQMVNDSWQALDGPTTDEADLRIRGDTAGPHVFQLKATAGSDDIYSGTLTVYWLDEVLEIEKNPRFGNCGFWTISKTQPWEEAASSPRSDHYVKIMQVKPKVAYLSDNEWTCFKVRTGSEVVAAQDITVGGTLSIFRKRLDGTLPVLDSAGLTLDVLARQYAVLADADPILGPRSSQVISCSWCQGVIVESDPIAEVYPQYLRRPVIRAEGDHTIVKLDDNRVERSTDIEVTTDRRFPPEVCGLSDDQVILVHRLSWAALGVSIVEFLAQEAIDILHLCSNTYRRELVREMVYDITTSKANSIADRVIPRFISIGGAP